jgi:hypothetical protein
MQLIASPITRSELKSIAKERFGDMVKAVVFKRSSEKLYLNSSMTNYHKQLSVEEWQKKSLAEHMANIGAEVGRADKWKQKGKPQLATPAFHRALELLDKTVQTTKQATTLKELLRLRETLVDYFAGENKYSQHSSWDSYFHPFNYAARKGTVTIS